MDIKDEQYKQWLEIMKESKTAMMLYWKIKGCNKLGSKGRKKITIFLCKHTLRTCARAHALSSKLKLLNTLLTIQTQELYLNGQEVTQNLPIWGFCGGLKFQPTRQFNTMVLVGTREDSAINLLADLQEQLAYNDLYTHDFGHQIKTGSGQRVSFQL